MMQGITALPGAQQGPQAQQAPGQATPFQAMPAAQPQTPQAMTGQLQNLPPQQLLQMFANPADKTPKWAVVTAYAKAIEQQRLMDAARGQSAMQQSQMQGQQPPVAAQVMSQPVSIAQGFSGGGAVAFQSGAGPLGLPFSNDVGILPVSSDLNPGETREEYIERKRREAAESREMGMSGLERLLRRFSPESKLRRALYPDTAPPVASGTEDYSHETRVGLRSKPVPPAAAVAAALPPAPAPAQPRANRPGTGASAAAAPATPAPTGLGALIAEQFKRLSAGENPEIVRIGKEAEKSAQDTAALLQRMQSLSPEEAAARAQYYKTVEGAYEPQRKSLEAARASTKEGLLQSPEALARLASAFGGAKRVGQGLSAAAGAAGEVLGERRKRAEQLEERYQTLSSQLAITTAQAQRADVEGDEKRKRELMLQAQGLKDRLLATQMDLLKTSQGMRAQDIAGIAALTGTQAQMIQAGKPTDFQQKLALFRSDPKTYEAMFGSKEAQMLTRVQQVTNTDPLLKELAGKASMNMPGALEQYNARYRELIAQHAPELLLAGTGGAPGGGALSAATNIVRGGQQ